MSNRLIYSISTGRCGTMFLANLIRANCRKKRPSFITSVSVS